MVGQGLEHGHVVWWLGDWWIVDGGCHLRHLPSFPRACRIADWIAGMTDPVRSVYRTAGGAGRLGLASARSGGDRSVRPAGGRPARSRGHDLEVELCQLQAKSGRPGIEGCLALGREPVAEGPDAPRLGPAEGIDLPRRHAPDAAFFGSASSGRDASRASMYVIPGLRVESVLVFRLWSLVFRLRDRERSRRPEW